MTGCEWLNKEEESMMISRTTEQPTREHCHTLEEVRSIRMVLGWEETKSALVKLHPSYLGTHSSVDNLGKRGAVESQVQKRGLSRMSPSGSDHDRAAAINYCYLEGHRCQHS